MPKPTPSAAKPEPIVERRHSVFRRDLNELVRDPQGKVSAGKVGSIVGQFIAAKYLLVHNGELIGKPEALLILLCVLTVPELVKKLVQMKYGAK